MAATLLTSQGKGKDQVFNILEAKKYQGKANNWDNLKIQFAIELPVLFAMGSTHKYLLVVCSARIAQTCSLLIG